jgi:hypothetical protein
MTAAEGLATHTTLVSEATGLSKHVWWARAVLASNVLVHGTGVLFGVYQVFLFRNGAAAVDPDAAQANLERFGLLDVASWVTLLAGAIGFLRWLHATYRVATRVVTRPLALTPSAAVAAFFLPIVSLYRPYSALRDLDQKLEPSEIAEPPIRPASTGAPEAAAGYREPAIEQAAPRKAVPRAPVLAWWFAWIGAAIVSIGASLGGDSLSTTIGGALLYQLTEVTGATLAIVMVTRIHRRLVERAHRMAAQAS